jgi:hypothetical protein
MAQPIYTGSTILLYIEMWDKTKSEDKPTYRPHDAWLLPADVDEITLTIRKPGVAEDEVQTLTDGDITFTGRVGKWQAHFDADDGAGYYKPIWVGLTEDGYTGVEVTKPIRVKALPT